MPSACGHGRLAGAAILCRAGSPSSHSHLPHAPCDPTLLPAVFLVPCSSGCFHEDGLADSLDGFGGGWGREQILRIMKARPR